MRKMTFLFVLIAGYAYSQNNYSFSNPITRYFPNNFCCTARFGPAESVVVLKGSPFVAEEFKTGIAIIHGKTDFKAPMRYNSAKGVIEFKDDDGVIKELLRRPYIKANFDGKIYEILEYSHNGKTKLGYFNTMSFGKTKFLFKPQKQVVIESNGLKYRRNKIFAHYKDVSDYYIKKEGLPATKTKLSKKSVLDSFDISNKKLLEFAIRIKGLNLNKEKDVINLLDYYDTLQKNSIEVKDMQS